MIETLPLVIADGAELRPVVYAMNDAARGSRIALGMTIASAKVLQHELIVVPRNTTKELRTLKRIANALLLFTPSVSIEEDINRAGIALEISGSLVLFGGLDSLVNRVQSCIRQMDYQVSYGIAPNPMAASLFARDAENAKDAQPVRRCLTQSELRDMLSPISVSRFAWSNNVFRSLATLGLTVIADVLRQPYAGLRKRFGDNFVRDLDLALGHTHEVRKFYAPPETFESHLDFLFEIKEADRLLQSVEELLIEFEGFLRARGAGVTEIRLELKQGRSRSQYFEFHTRTPVRKAAHWLRLVSDRIEIYELEYPVIEISLFANRIVSLRAENDSLLPLEKGTSSDWFGLLDRLASRLGEKNVYRITSIDDHRPELAWRSGSDETRSSKSRSLTQKRRPTWLLCAPKSLIEMEGRPQYNGPLSLLAGPERIDTGWWDNKPVARDYFVAINPHQEVCWVFRDYRRGKRWYLHGFFS